MAARMPRTMAATRQADSRESEGAAGRGGSGEVAGSATAGSGSGFPAGRGAPHSPQKTSSSRRTAPQFLHWMALAIIYLSPLCRILSFSIWCSSCPRGPWAAGHQHTVSNCTPCLAISRRRTNVSLAPKRYL
jgi:hypothetical protein